MGWVKSNQTYQLLMCCHQVAIATIDCLQEERLMESQDKRVNIMATIWFEISNKLIKHKAQRTTQHQPVSFSMPKGSKMQSIHYNTNSLNSAYRTTKWARPLLPLNSSKTLIAAVPTLSSNLSFFPNRHQSRQFGSSKILDRHNNRRQDQDVLVSLSLAKQTIL